MKVKHIPAIVILALIFEGARFALTVQISEQTIYMFFCTCVFIVCSCLFIIPFFAMKAIKIVVAFFVKHGDKRI